MPITPLNQQKNVITPHRVSKGGVAAWDDQVVTWDSADLFWDSPIYSVTNQTKHTISPTNQTKN